MNLLNFLLNKEIEYVLCCFSGGKDSLVATHIAHEEIENSSLDVPVEVIYVDTTLGLNGVKGYVKKVCKSFDWNLKILKPRKSFWELAAAWGMPTPKRRWCRRLLKLQPMFDYVIHLEKKLGVKKVCFITGIRNSESRRRKNLPKFIERRIKNVISYNFAPIIDWSNEEVIQYIEEHNLPINPLYDILNSSGDCFCVVFAKVEDLIKVAKYFPEFIRRFEELERVWKEGKFKGKTYRPFYANGKKLSVEDIIKMATYDK